jgi:hypothetical protein
MKGISYRYPLLKRAAGFADNRSMLRTVTLIGALVVLVASGGVLYGQIQKHGVAGAFSFGESGRPDAVRELMAAAAGLERSLATGGSYSRTDLSRFGDVHFAYVSGSRYCIQVEKGGKWYHLTGPGGVPQNGPCVGA